MALLVALATVTCIPALLRGVARLASSLLPATELSRFLEASAANVSISGPGLLVVLLSTVILCGAGAFAIQYVPSLRGALPALPALLIGAGAAFWSRGGEIPPGALLATGSVVAVLTFLIVGSYWYVLTHGTGD